MMSAVLMEEKSTSTSLSAEFLAVFAKACYLKKYLNETDKHTYAKDALIDWANQYGQNVSNWQVLDIPGNNASGVYETLNSFAAVAYGRYDTNNKLQEIVIAYRGTDSILDWTPSNLQILLTLTPSQKNKAIEFYDKVAENYEGIDITITGHSLGGAIAQLLGAKYGNKTVTFNVPGMLNMLDQIGCSTTAEYSNITNYAVLNDYVGNFRAHVGDTYYIPPIPVENEPFYDTHNGIFAYTEATHGEIFSKIPGFTTEHALALWFYDQNNDLLDVKNLLATKVKPQDLYDAILLVEQYVGNVGNMPKTLRCIAGTEGYMIGTSGNDSIQGGATNDIIWGNQGNDNIRGLDGNDLIIDYGTALGEDSITVKNQELENNTVERIQLSDGKYLSNEDINKIIQNMTSYAANNGIEFTNIESVKNNEDLMNLVASSWHM